MAKDNQKIVLKKVLRRIRPYAPAMVGSLILALIHVAATLYIPICVGTAIDGIRGSGKVQFEWVAQSLLFVGRCTSHGNTNYQFATITAISKLLFIFLHQLY